MDCYRQTISSDASLIDQNDQSIMVDCSVTLPLLFGQPAEIRVGIPNEAMPIPNLRAPWQIKILQGPQKIILEDVYYRSVTAATIQKRKLGATPVQLSHIKSLTMEMGLKSSDCRFLVYISDAEYFKTLHLEEEKNSISKISTFSHPELGDISLQQYSVESTLLNGSGSLKKNGYSLEIECFDPNKDHESIIEDIQPLLDIMSLFSRQRILILGWEKQTKSEYVRHWKYPLDTIQTSYCLYEPQLFLVSHFEFENMVNTGLNNYYKLSTNEKQIVHKFSFNLCSALERRDDVKYMALFSALESYAKKSKPKIEDLDTTSSKAIELIEDIAMEYKTANHPLFRKLKGLTNEIKRHSAANSINDLLSKYNVLTTDLWAIKTKNGLLTIRNHLAHEGNHGVDHQGLAVATLHLSILIERLVLGVLKLKLETSVQQDLRREPWLDLEYANKLKGLIIQK